VVLVVAKAVAEDAIAKAVTKAEAEDAEAASTWSP
jgi:hypothetical protein